MKLSVILPTYNEEGNVKVLIPKIETVISKKFGRKDFEIILVDDGSKDKTREVAQNYNKKYKNIRVINRKKLLGIGSANRDGYNAAKGDLILSMDADQSLDPKNIPRLLKKIEKNDLVVGTKQSNKGGYEKRPGLKYFLSKFGNKLNKFLSGANVSDFTLNFRVMRKTAWNQIKTKENSNTFFFEVVLKMHYKGLRIDEIPVIFKERVYGDSKLNLFTEAPKFLFKTVALSLQERFRYTMKRIF